MSSGDEQRSLWAAPVRFARDTRGATAMIFAIMLPVLAGMAALAIDVGVWMVQKRSAQGAADQAAYSAAIASKGGATDTAARIGARDVAGSAGFVNGVGGVTVTATKPAPGYSGLYWEVIVQQPQRAGLARLLFGGTTTVAARAVAGGTSFGNGCIIALSKTAATAVNIMNQADVPTTTCGIYSNSTHNRTSVACGNVTGNGNGANGNCTINASVYAAGAVAGTSGMHGTIVQNSTLPSGFDNPYPNVPLTAPAPANCTYTVANLTYGSTQLAAGTYCVSGTLTFNNTVVGVAASNVTIILGSAATVAALPNTGEVYINAPTSGTYANIAIMSLNPAGMNFTNGNNGNGTALTFHIQGAIYAPTGPLSFTGGTQFDTTMCTQLIGQTVTIGLHANMGSNCPGPGSGNAGSTSISLVE